MLLLNLKKWDLIFEEISRVLCPGGSVEIIEEGNATFTCACIHSQVL